MIFHARTINFLANMIAFAAVVILLVTGVWWVIHRPMFNLKHIDIEPETGHTLNYVTPASIAATIEGRVEGNFFTVNLHELTDLVETTPWVRSVQARRVWPDSILLSVQEHEPFAYWNNGQMIDTWGDIFTPSSTSKILNSNLPQFFGPVESEKLVVQRYADLMRLIAPLKLTIQKMSLSDRYAWKVYLSNGIELIIGRDPSAESANPYGSSGAAPFADTVSRFVKAWPEIKARIGSRQISVVDLRYPRGFAIKFASVTSTEPNLGKEKK